MSRGVAPIACRPRTRSSTVAPCCRVTLRAFSSFALTFCSGTIAVCPAASSFGWLTVNWVWISTESDPWRIDTGAMGRSFPRMIVPVRSLMMIFEWVSESSDRSWIWPRNSTRFEAKPAGTVTDTKPGLIALASGSLKWSLITNAMRAAPAESGRLTCNLSSAPSKAEVGTMRSTNPPATIRPTVGWLTVCELPPFPAENPPVTTGPWAAT